MIDPEDPLAGRDPYPRTLVDTLRLDLARTDLLEEIVSTPGPARPSSPTRTRVLLALGVAAALAIIGGGAWAVSGGDHARDDTNVASAPTTATQPSATSSGRPDDVRRAGVRIGKVEQLGQCRMFRNGRTRMSQLLPLDATLKRLRHGSRVYLTTADGSRHVVVIDQQCRIRYLRDLDGLATRDSAGR